MEDYKSYVICNPDKRFSGIDYIFRIYDKYSLQDDFILWMAKLFWPEFIQVDDRIFVKDLFYAEKHSELIVQGESAASAQYWCNLLETTELFPRMNIVEVIEFTNILVKCWNAKLATELDVGAQSARLLHDTELDEVFITISE